MRAKDRCAFFSFLCVVFRQAGPRIVIPKGPHTSPTPHFYLFYPDSSADKFPIMELLLMSSEFSGI